MGNPLGHWELLVNDVAKAREFYSSVFDWEFDESSFPGYVLIKMKLTDELWHLLMDIPRVAGFVGGNNRDPQALSEKELSHIRSQMSEGFRQATLKDEFDVGQQVIVIDGPFANFTGKIDEVNVEKNKLRVLISILGRSTPVELDFDKVKAHPDVR